MWDISALRAAEHPTWRWKPALTISTRAGNNFLVDKLITASLLTSGFF
jgi:hypothetical protein